MEREGEGGVGEIETGAEGGRERERRKGRINISSNIPLPRLTTFQGTEDPLLEVHLPRAAAPPQSAQGVAQPLACSRPKLQHMSTKVAEE